MKEGREEGRKEGARKEGTEDGRKEGARKVEGRKGGDVLTYFCDSLQICDGVRGPGQRLGPADVPGAASAQDHLRHPR